MANVTPISMLQYKYIGKTDDGFFLFEDKRDPDQRVISKFAVGTYLRDVTIIFDDSDSPDMLEIMYSLRYSNAIHYTKANLDM